MSFDRRSMRGAIERKLRNLGDRLTGGANTFLHSIRPPLPKRFKYKYSVLGLARWETVNIAEWISYYQYLGFDHIYLYCNDDDPGDLYTQISQYTSGKDPFVTFVYYPHQGHQWWMWMDFFNRFKDETEWIAIFDIDEFLNLPRHRSIDDFMSDGRSKADCIYFYWSFFGNNGYEEQAQGSVIRNYTRRQIGIDKNTKTITRTSCIDQRLLRHEMRFEIGFVYPNHGWSSLTSKPMRAYDVLGNDMSGYFIDFPNLFCSIFEDSDNTTRVYETAVLHHYAFKATSDFTRRVKRGLGGSHGIQAIWQKRFKNNEHLNFLADINAVEDSSLKHRWEAHLDQQLAQSRIFERPSEPLLSFEKPALQSSVWPPDPEANLALAASKAVNGVFTGGPNVHTDFEQSPWWRVDLKQRCQVSEVHIYNRVDVSTYMERHRWFWLEISDDDISYRAVTHAELDDVVFGGIDGKPFIWRPEGPVTARYVRIIFPHVQTLNLDQVEVYGVADV